MKKILITGATGFCGTHLVKALTESGYEVSGTHYGKSGNRCEAATYYNLNICDPEAVQDVVKRARPDAVVHLAAQTVPGFSWERTQETFNVNIHGTVHLLDAIQKQTPKARVLFISSSLVYGRAFEKKSMMTEGDLTQPEDPYAVSKLVGENIGAHYASQGLDVVIARPFNHFGEGQEPHFVFSDWTHQIAEIEKRNREPVLEVGDLDVERDFLSVHDVVSAYQVLLEKGESRQVYNVCSEKPVLLQDCLDHLLSIASCPIKVQRKEGKQRAFNPKVVGGIAEKIRLLGWSPKVKVFDQLTKTLEDWRARILIS